VNVQRLAFSAGIISYMLCGSASAETIRVQGSATVAQIFTLAAPVVKEKLGLDLKIRTDGGSTAAIGSVAAGAVNLAITTRSLSGEDRSDFPERRMNETLIGVQALVFIVSADIWESGLRSMSKADLRAIYEGATKKLEIAGRSGSANQIFQS
jgi:phosphate transport system substrate-binding protein